MAVCSFHNASPSGECRRGIFYPYEDIYEPEQKVLDGRPTK